ncbi:MAG: CapA family protein [Bacteroidales bacterium]|nr:CapA family protein [Bacteroidales bacterium]
MDFLIKTIGNNICFQVKHIGDVINIAIIKSSSITLNICNRRAFSVLGNNCLLVLLPFFLLCLYSCNKTIDKSDSYINADKDTLSINSENKSSKVKLIFSGDFMIHQPQIERSKKENGGHDFDYYFKYISSYHTDADFSIINFETTISKNPPFSGYPRFRVPHESMTAIKKGGIDVVLFANNHICDNGDNGIKNNIFYADSLNLLYTGAFLDSLDLKKRNPLVLEKNGIKIGLLNYTYATNGMPVPNKRIVNLIDTVNIKNDIVRSKNIGVNTLIIVFHWGEEYRHKPTNYQKQICEWSIRNGANLIVGSHPHVVQPIAYGFDNDLKSPLVVYSLGNYVSNQQDLNCRGGISFSIELEKTLNRALKYKNGEYLITWVNQHDEGEIKKYTVIPSFIADTLYKNKENHKDYFKFVENTRKLLKMAPIDELSFSKP